MAVIIDVYDLGGASKNSGAAIRSDLDRYEG
jgi:hypothetical protein